MALGLGMRARGGRWWRLAAALALVLGLLVGALGSPGGAAAAPVTVTFDYSPATQPWVVPADVTSITVTAYGAAGGYNGGLGGQATATLDVTPGTVVNVNVGGQGSDSGFGGTNGGGNGGFLAFPNINGGGGGASDVRLGGNALTDRILVAGGGGGGLNGSPPFCLTLPGGGGGGLVGGAGVAYNPILFSCTLPGGAGGDQTGMTGSTQQGFGGSASPSVSGGGGGGWYGGGAIAGASGGGGSGHGPAGTVFQTGVRAGNGQVVITYSVSVALTVVASGGTVGRDPAGTGTGPFFYSIGSTVTLTPQPDGGQTFVRWLVDDVARGWAPSLTITMDVAHKVQAVFAPTKTFTDVLAGRDDYAAIVALATRGYIAGYSDTVFAPDKGITRAEMAALIARATPTGPHVPTSYAASPPCVAGSWDCEIWPNDFTDRGDLVDNLWRDVAVLKHYGVAVGYTDADCAKKGLASPCYAPNAPVSYVETIAFITRAMEAKGYWVAQPGAPQPYAGVPAIFNTDVATFVYYTGIIAAPPMDWNAGATRGWFARQLWQALNTYWGTDGLLPDGRPAGGYVP